MPCNSRSWALLVFREHGLVDAPTEREQVTVSEVESDLGARLLFGQTIPRGFLHVVHGDQTWRRCVALRLDSLETYGVTVHSTAAPLIRGDGQRPIVATRQQVERAVG